jgi:asparagine synthase (glutamine-hydrolysing)
MEKWILRKAFEEYLPKEVAWRQKEQFSDGVGYGWIDSLKQLTSSQVSDADLANAKYRFPINPPHEQGGVFLPQYLQWSFPFRCRRAMRALRPFGGLLHPTGTRLGQILPKPQ